MSKPAAPSMPTPRQIAEAFEAVKALHPGARIKSVGPEGVAFDYPDAATLHPDWDKAFVPRRDT
jgi:hypothetical protein